MSFVVFWADLAIRVCWNYNLLIYALEVKCLQKSLNSKITITINLKAWLCIGIFSFVWNNSWRNNLINKRHGSRILKRHGQTLDLTEKFTSINLFKILWVVTWAWLFLTSLEAIRGQTLYSNSTLWHLLKSNSKFGPSHNASSAYQKK